MGYYIDKVFTQNRPDYVNIELNFLVKKEDDKAVVFAVLTHAPDEKCYYWVADEYTLEVEEAECNTPGFKDNGGNALTVCTALEGEQVSTIEDLLTKAELDYTDVEEFEKYYFVGIKKPRKITNIELMKAISELSEKMDAILAKLG